MHSRPHQSSVAATETLSASPRSYDEDDEPDEEAEGDPDDEDLEDDEDLDGDEDASDDDLEAEQEFADEDEDGPDDRGAAKPPRGYIRDSYSGDLTPDLGPPGVRGPGRPTFGTPGGKRPPDQRRIHQALRSADRDVTDEDGTDAADGKISQVWLGAARMSCTECALRVGMWLIKAGHAAGDVDVALRGRELTRRNMPTFPVVAFLTSYRFLPRVASDDWKGAYAADGFAHGLTLSARRTGPDVLVRLGPHQQMHIAVAAGRLEASGSSTEFKVLWGVIGRAVSAEGIGQNDLVAAAVPRSEQFRKAAGGMRQATRVQWAGLSVLTVDRAGNVDGSPFAELI